MKSRARRFALRGVTLLLGLGLGLFAAELGLRLIGFEFNLYPTRVQLGWPDPVTISEMYQPDPDLLWVQKDYDRKLAAAVAARPALVMMGCSCTEYGEHDKHLQDVVRRDDPAATLACANFGVAGWSSYQGLRQLERDVVRIGPRVITIYYGWNDHWSTFGIEDKDMAGHTASYPEFMTALSERFRLAQLANKVVYTRNMQGKSSGQRVPLEDFRANLARMVQVAREAGIVPVLLTAPTSHQVGKEPAYLAERWLPDLADLVPLHKSYVAAVREVAAAHDVLLLDLYAAFAALPEEERARYFGGDGIHLTDEGNRRIAEHMHAFFSEADLLEPLTAGAPAPRRADSSRPAH